MQYNNDTVFFGQEKIYSYETHSQCTLNSHYRFPNPHKENPFYLTSTFVP